MLKWLFLVLGFAIATGLVFLALVGINPKPIKVINPSKFTNLQHIGFSTMERLFPDIGPHSLIVLGSSTDIDNYNEVWLGFLKALGKYQKKKIFLIEDSQLIPIVRSGAIEASIRVPIENLLWVLNKQIKKYKTDDYLFVLHLTNAKASTLTTESLAKDLREQVKVRFISIAQEVLALNATQLDKWQQKCEKEKPSTLLKCKAESVSKKYFRKKYPTNKLMAVAERFGVQDFITFIHIPVN